MTFSRAYYEAYAVETGEGIDHATSYANARIIARMEEIVRMEEITDEFFASKEECAAAVAACRCEVRFVRAEVCV